MSLSLSARPALSEINITPLIDVMLVLLIIFIVTAPILPRQLDATLPQRSPQPVTPSQAPKLLVEIQADGSFQLDGRPLSQALLAERLADARAADARAQVSLHADAAASYQAMAEALALVRRSEITQVAILP